MKYEKLIDAILEGVGGKENITSVTNCFTRLRLRFNDFDKVNDDAIKGIDGVMGTNVRGEEYQIIIGGAVGDVAKEFQQKTNISGEAQVSTKKPDGEKVSTLDRFIDVVVGIFIPIIGIMAASGTLKGFLSLAVQMDWMTKETGTYLVLAAIADAIFYYLPVIVGFTAGKKFGATPYLTAIIGLVMVSPSMVAAYGSGASYTFLGIPLVMVSYTTTVIPTIAAAYLAAKVEALFNKIVPNVIKVIFVPFFVLLITVPIALLAIGPVATLLATGLGAALKAIYSFSPMLTGFIFGGLWQVAILFGLAWGFTPVLIGFFGQFGYDPIYGTLAPAAMGVAGAAIAVAMKTKNGQTKSLAYTTGITAFISVTEPALYGVLVPAKRPFIFACFANAIAGLFAGVTGVKVYTPALSGIFNLIGYIGPEDVQRNVTFGALSLVIAFVVAFGLTYVWGWSDERVTSEVKKKPAYS
ncbi:PTS transporter subunit EIIC [Trichococcus shcherbakoviae]|uniref:PTS transporter subunit EIIC n=1 Tax=Trichococcus shcherbakoviae TaxID=2094020 RepID=UPI002AA71A45|nr:PTS transporter subunit EIIC [Trichococcus shcherbakoviae]